MIRNIVKQLDEEIPRERPLVEGLLPRESGYVALLQVYVFPNLKAL